MRFLSALGFMLSALPSTRANYTNGTTELENLDATTIESLGNNTLFTRWRPTSHFIAPAGWMNVSNSNLWSSD
jgi:beta-fructofuranosidase